MDIQSLKSILKFISNIMIFLSIFFFIPIITGLIYHENIEGFLFFDLGLLFFNLIIYILLIKHTFEMSIKSGILATNLIWLSLGVVGAIPLILDTHISFANGFFEAVSGFTTTGATIYTHIDTLPKNVLILRSLMHWLGGMGIIILGVGLFSLINPTGSITLFKAESTGIKFEKLTPKIKDTAFRLWMIYIFLTFIDCIFLKLEGMSFFDAINHSFSTISTGGFSTKDSSLGYWSHNSLIIWTTTIFMFISGINFLAHLRVFNKDFSGYKSCEVRGYLYIFLILSLILSFVHFFTSKDGFFFSLTHSFFTISSIITTTGFASLNYEEWANVAISIIFIAMLIGGNAGSTAGGVKVIRYIILFKNLFSQLKKILYPNVVLGIYIDKNKIGNNILALISGFLFLFILTNSLLTLYLFGQGYDFLTSISTSIACIGNIGPGFSLTGPANNYLFFSPANKIILALFMIAGRLEFYTVILLFSRSFWKRF